MMTRSHALIASVVLILVVMVGGVVFLSTRMLNISEAPPNVPTMRPAVPPAPTPPAPEPARPAQPPSPAPALTQTWVLWSGGSLVGRTVGTRSIKMSPQTTFDTKATCVTAAAEKAREVHEDWKRKGGKVTLSPQGPEIAQMSVQEDRDGTLSTLRFECWPPGVNPGEWGARSPS